MGTKTRKARRTQQRGQKEAHVHGSQAISDKGVQTTWGNRFLQAKPGHWTPTSHQVQKPSTGIKDHCGNPKPVKFLEDDMGQEPHRPGPDEDIRD